MKIQTPILSAEERFELAQEIQKEICKVFYQRGVVDDVVCVMLFVTSSLIEHEMQCPRLEAVEAMQDILADVASGLKSEGGGG